MPKLPPKEDDMGYTGDLPSMATNMRNMQNHLKRKIRVDEIHPDNVTDEERKLMSEKVIYNKDIKGIELTYEGHCFIDLDALFEGEKNPFAADTVKKWWVKYGRLHVELYNGIIIEKCVIHHVGWCNLHAKNY